MKQKKERLNKKDWLPVAALILFAVVVVGICVVTLQDKDEKSGSETESTQSEGTQEAGKVLAGGALDTGGLYISEETEKALQERSEEQTEAQSEVGTSVDGGTVPSGDSGQAAVVPQAGAAQSVGEGGNTRRTGLPSPGAGTGLVSGNSAAPNKAAASVSGNSAAAAEPDTDKTNEQMLKEMADYWSSTGVAAVQDLAGLPRYREMSSTLKSKASGGLEAQKSGIFYYYGERNGNGDPEGKGIAVYGDDQYYYGSWKDGLRSGSGMWIKMYFYEDTDRTSDRTYVAHSYEGGWLNNLPNGKGQDHYDLNIRNAIGDERYVQNVIGNFYNGKYNGEMYIITQKADGSLQEWIGKAANGVWASFEGRDEQGRIPVCAGVENPDDHLWIEALSNRNCGVTELIRN